MLTGSTWRSGGEGEVKRIRISLSLVPEKKKQHAKLWEKIQQDANPGEYADLIEKIVWSYYFGKAGAPTPAPAPQKPKARPDLGGFML